MRDIDPDLFEQPMRDLYYQTINAFVAQVAEHKWNGAEKFIAMALSIGNQAVKEVEASQ